MTPPPPTDPDEIAQLQRAFFAAEDSVEQAAIEGRLRQLGALPDPVPSAEEDDGPLPPLPGPKELQQAEGLVRQARVEKMRGKGQAALDLVRQAAEIAPGSASVQEALGDDLTERSRPDEAIAALRLAKRLDPSNVAVDRKLAALLAKTRDLKSIEDQLRSSLSDGLLPGQEDAAASPLAAGVFNAFLPGLGHLVVGKVAVGVGLLAAWILLGMWVTVQRADLALVLSPQPGKPSNPTVLVPVFLMIGLWSYGLVSLAKKGKAAPKARVERPEPPANLPFE